MNEPLAALTYTYMGQRHVVGYNIEPRDADRVFNRLTALVNLVVGAANTIAGKHLNDLALDVWPRYPKIFRHEVKRHFNDALRQFREYERLHYQGFGDRHACFIDYLDEVEDAIQPHVDKFFWSAKLAMDRSGDPQSELHARVEMGYALLDVAVGVYDKVLDMIKTESGMDFHKVMSAGRLDGVERSYNLMRKIVYPHRLNLVRDENCALAVTIICQRLTDTSGVLDKAAMRAAGYHPEVEKYIKNEV